jgi:hypothetical protein
MLLACLRWDILSARHPLIAFIPYNTPLCRTSLGTGRYIMVSHALYAFVGINIIDLFSGRIILIIHDGFHRTLVDAGSAVDADICDQYCHLYSFFGLSLKL